MSKKILVVDDEAHIRLLYTEELTEEGYEVITAEGGLNLLERYEKHTEGARQNKAAKKPVLHFIVRFPPEVLTDEGPSPFSVLDREGRERLMLRQAVKFIQDTHGGQAVFAARLDRDEAGETVVDVFACPK